MVHDRPLIDLQNPRNVKIDVKNNCFYVDLYEEEGFPKIDTNNARENIDEDFVAPFPFILFLFLFSFFVALFSFFLVFEIFW